MKKLISMLLALAMMLGCVAFAEGVDYTGTWVLTGAESSGVQMGPSTLAMMGMDMKIVLTAEGSATIVMMGLEEVGTWAATETGIALTDATGVLEVTYQNEMLLMEQAGTLMMFTREGAAPAIDEAAGPAVLAGVDPVAFEGQWLLTSASVMGMEMSTEDLGTYMALVLSQGSALFGTADENGGLVTEEVSYTVTEVEGVGTVCTIIGENATTGEIVEVLALNMLDDGRLVWSLDMEGMTVDYYFTKQVEETAAE